MLNFPAVNGFTPIVTIGFACAKVLPACAPPPMLTPFIAEKGSVATVDEA